MKKVLLNNFFLRLGVQFVERLSGLIVVPILITHVGVGGYGLYGLASGVIMLFVNIICLRFTMAMIRFYPGTRAAAGQTIAAGLLYWCAFATASVGLLLVAPATFADLLFADASKTKLLFLAVGVGLTSTLYEFTSATLRAENRFVGLSIIDASERVFFILGCVLVFQFGGATVETALWILGAGNAAKLVAVLSPSLRGVKLELPPGRLMRDMFLFCLPFLPHLTAVWLIERAPFFFVAQDLGDRATGVLTLAFTIGSVLAAVVYPLQTTLFPMLARAHDDGRSGDLRELMSVALRLTLSCAAFGTLSLTLGAKPLIELLGIDEALPPTSLILGMCLAFSMSALRQLATNLLHVEKRTVVLWWIAPVSAVVAVIVTLALLSKIGLLGAAAGMIAGTAVQTLATLRCVSAELVEAPSRNYMIALGFTTAVAIVLQGACLAWGPLPYLFGLLASAVLFLAGQYAFGGLTAAERAAVDGYFARWFGRQRAS